jgi:hypothetical protein
MYYKCVKFHKNPISGLGGVALTRYMDGEGDSYIPPPQTLFEDSKYLREKKQYVFFPNVNLFDKLASISVIGYK